MLHFYLVPDSYSRAQTRESVESAKNGLEYESFEYESRLDTPLKSLSAFDRRLHSLSIYYSYPTSAAYEMEGEREGDFLFPLFPECQNITV